MIKLQYLYLDQFHFKFLPLCLCPYYYLESSVQYCFEFFQIYLLYVDYILSMIIKVISCNSFRSNYFQSTIFSNHSSFILSSQLIH